MDDRKQAIRKKTVLLNIKKQLEKITSLNVIEFIEAESEEIIKYSENAKELHSYSYPLLCTRKIDGDNEKLVEWFLTNLSFVKNDSVWLMPFHGMGFWWVKVKVVDCKKALNDLWKLGDILIADIESKAIFYIGVSESTCEIALKQL